MISLKSLQHFYVKSREHKKLRKLVQLLDKFEFDQAIIFVDSPPRCAYLCMFLVAQCFPTKQIHNEMPRNDRCVKSVQIFDKKFSLVSQSMKT